MSYKRKEEPGEERQAEASSCGTFLLAVSSVSGRRGMGMSWFGRLS